jgi:hypothetical protein
MTTLVLQLPVEMAKRFAKAADTLNLHSHEDVGLTAIGLFLDSVLGKVRGRKALSERTKRQRARQRKVGSGRRG